MLTVLIYSGGSYIIFEDAKNHEKDHHLWRYNRRQIVIR